MSKPIFIEVNESAVYIDNGVHIELPKGIIYYLTAKNEKTLKLLLFELYKPDTSVYIYESKENIKLEDIFET